jgi:PHD/YefM family antitoxin component YafN of YafNO toxin-antitoxin module
MPSRKCPLVINRVRLLSVKARRIGFTAFRKELRYNVEHVEHTKEPLAVMRNRRVVGFFIPVETYTILEEMDNCTISIDC